MSMLAPVSFAEAVRVWFKIGCLGFGGPAGQIALLHRFVVDEKKWVSETQFLHALNYCMLLPGPEAQQLATYLGWLLHGVRGGLAAGILFILPGLCVIIALSVLYAELGSASWLMGAFYGLKCAVIAIVLEALLRVAKRALKTTAARMIAVAAFLALALFQIPFPLVIGTAAAVGWVFLRSSSANKVDDGPILTRPASNGSRLWRLVRSCAIGALLWFGPIAALGVLLGGDHLFTAMGIFFAKMAVVTFGGAYAVLTYVAQQVVDRYGWISPPTMIDGLALAETTPGPLILVLSFVGFMAAYQQPGELSPLMAGVLGSVYVTWTTFVPSFIWIFVGAPYIERLRKNVALSAMLAGVTAAVVGVIANLALWFALHVVFADVTQLTMGPFDMTVPDPSSLRWPALLLSALSIIALLKFHFGLIKTLAASVVLGYLAAALT